MGRLGLAIGKFKPLAEQIDPAAKPASKTDRSDPLAFGEYLVKTSCTECHGSMTEVGETRFPRMTDDEVNAMRVYLRKRFAAPADVRSASEPQKKASNAG